MTAERSDPDLAAPAMTDDAVAAYLQANPGFLARRVALFATLEPPERVHGAVLADHMAAMIRAARGRAVERDAQAELVLAAGRAAAGIIERVHEAVLAVLEAHDVAECVAETWPGLLGVDAAALCGEAFRPRWRILPLGSVHTLMRGRPTVFRDRPADAAMLHAEAALLAERDVLVDVPGRDPALLALVSRDRNCLPVTQSWAFLGRVLGALVADD